MKCSTRLMKCRSLLIECFCQVHTRDVLSCRALLMEYKALLMECRVLLIECRVFLMECRTLFIEYNALLIVFVWLFLQVHTCEALMLAERLSSKKF